jgi:hypothetical protein
MSSYRRPDSVGTADEKAVLPAWHVEDRFSDRDGSSLRFRDADLAAVESGCRW